MQESLTTLVAVAVIVSGFVVLGVAWLIYLGHGGKPVHVVFEGLGIKVDIARPYSDSDKGTDQTDVTS